MYLYPKLLIVCEGNVDKMILAHLVQRLLAKNSIEREVEIIPAYGKAVIPRMVRAIEARLGPHPTVIVVDSDGNRPRTWAVLRTKLPGERHSLVIAEPSVKSWVSAGLRGGKHTGRPNEVQAAQTVDLRFLERSHPEFEDFRIAVTSPTLV